MTTTPTSRRGGWRIVDIVVAAAVAVAFGVVFLAWNALAAATAPLFAFLPPAQAIMYGVWLLPGGARRAHRPAPGRGALRRARVGRRLGRCSARRTGPTRSSRARSRAPAPSSASRIGLYRRWTLPFAILAGALSGLFADACTTSLVYYPDAGCRRLGRLRRRHRR